MHLISIWTVVYHTEALAHMVCSSISDMKLMLDVTYLGLASLFLCYSSVLFQRVVLLLMQSTRWQQNAFKYLLGCHHSLYLFITPHPGCSLTHKRPYYSYCCILASLSGGPSIHLHHP